MMPRVFLIVAACTLCSMLPSLQLRAETGHDGWLRYAPVSADAYAELPNATHTLGDGAVIQSARAELARGLKGLLDRDLMTVAASNQSAILVGKLANVIAALPAVGQPPKLGPDGYWLKTLTVAGRSQLVIAGESDRGVLYGVFALLRRIALEQPVDDLDIHESPYAPIRLLNHWDNLDGSIERGYAGRSIFWEGGHIREDLSCVHDYARLMASVGINGCSVNNVNADVRAIDADHLAEIARVAKVFREWGVRTYISLNFASPREIGGIETFDPLDPAAVKFWNRKVAEIYQTIPDLGGFVLKADSEGRLGPSEYGRTHADAANVIARAARPFGGVLFYRGFVYNHKMDWRDLSLDRAKAAYDNFHRLDGLFEDNVVIQIKHGPIDFQVREPPSTLFGGLEKTNMAIELQVTQEYLGQQKHMCFTVPMWKEVLDFDLHAAGSGTPVKALAAGKTFDRPLGGFVGVSNVGRDENWLGHHLAMANLYGFGRLAWNPDLSSEQIAEEWTRQTFGNQSTVVETIVDMLLRSWSIYESYTGPLGIGTLTDIIHIHFGPAPESSEHNGWGQWHRANATGVGMNRTVATGTRFIGQYRESVAALFESVETCPDDLLLFMHHVPYAHVLKNGKTVIQHFYDEHYQGAEDAKGLVTQWRALKGQIDEQRYTEVLKRLEYQADHADVWRDSICNWFHRLSGIDDEHGRVENHRDRREAERLTLAGYEVTDITPWEAASESRAVQLPAGIDSGTVGWKFDGEPGEYDLAVQYFDEEDGISEFRLSVGGKEVDRWTADEHVPTPSDQPDAHTSSRRWFRNVELREGDSIQLIARTDGDERAGVDYFMFRPASNQTAATNEDSHAE